MDINNICKETSTTTIFIVLFVILTLCFIVNTKIGICVSIVFFVLFSVILYSRGDIKEGYEPTSKYVKSQENQYDVSYTQRKVCKPGRLPIPQSGTPCKKGQKLTYFEQVDPEIKAVKTSYITTKDNMIGTSDWKSDISATRYSGNKCKADVSSECYNFYNNPLQMTKEKIDKDYISKNNRLQGGANPKTLIPPMISRPCYGSDWRNTNMVVPNIINGSNNEDLYKSGYLSRDDDIQKDVVECYSVIENGPSNVDYVEKSWSDKINMADGYEKMDSKFPSNLPQGNCGRDKLFDDYNMRLFTQTVQPGVYYKNDIIEPINSNIGISFQQEFLPRTFNDVDNGLLIEDHDPNDAPEPAIVMTIDRPDVNNTYDPRFNGYGTSYRNYVDPVVGDTRYPYDDINAIKMPNYVSRSKIDTHNFADSYGPMQNSGLSLNQIRSKAEKSFLEDTGAFRIDMMSKLMRKTNSEMWQRRVAPISGSQRMLG